MAGVFGNALLTVAALGTSAGSGLPGVSKVPRRPQCRFFSGTHEFAYTSPKLETCLQQSRWMTRGWTFQEPSLSRRILYVTSYQAVLVCGHGEMAEEMRSRVPKVLRFSNNPTINCLLNPQMLKPYPEVPIRNPDYDDSLFVSQLRDYRTRYLTYDVDALDAYRDVLSIAPYRSWWGVPIYKVSSGYGDDNRRLAELAKSLEECASVGFAHGLLWRSSDEPAAGFSRKKRGTMFPSWSWASVEGSVVLHQSPKDDSELIQMLQGRKYPKQYALTFDYSLLRWWAKFLVSAPSRDQIPLEDFCNRHHDRFVLPETSHSLYIKGFIFDWPHPFFAETTATTDDDGVPPLRHRVLEPGRVLSYQKKYYSAQVFPDHHHTTFDAESLDEYRSIRQGEQAVKAVLLLTVVDPTRLRSADDDYLYWEPAPVAYYWLAVVFNGAIARRIGIIQSIVPSGYEMNCIHLKEGVWEVA